MNPNVFFIGSRQLLAQVPPNPVISIDGDIITPSPQVKNLGVYMDKFMLFDKHILTKKAVGVLMFLSRVGADFDKPSRIIVVQSLVLSMMNYCIRIWATTNLTLIYKVQELQNFAAKVAMGSAKKSTM